MNNEAPNLNIWFKVIGAIFLLIGLLFSLGIWIDYSKIQEVQTWPVTQGRLTMLYAKSSSMGQTNKLIKYQYKVNGQVFESSKINPNQYSQGKEDFFQIKKADHTAVFVHYNPKLPGQSYLVIEWNPFNSTHFYYAVSSIILATIFGIISLVVDIKQKARLSKSTSPST